MNYTRLANTVKRLINQNGREITVLKASREPADAAKPWRAPESDVQEIDLVGVIVPYEERNIDGTLIRLGDKHALIAALDMTDAITDQDLVDDGGVVYNIVQLSIINPGEVDLLYELQLRRTLT